MNKLINIFVSGGGDMLDTVELDTKFFSLLSNNSKILYIPIAMNTDKIGYETCYDWFSSIISKHNNNKEIDFSMLLKDDDLPDLNKFDSVYIGGGNTFYLLDYLIKKKLHIKLIDYINNRGIVYGGSAGAIILGKDIRTVKEENDKNYTKYFGINVINGYSIICHYDENLDKKIFSVMNKIKTPIIALPENSGICIVDGKVDVVGTAYVFDGNTKKILTSEVI